MKKNIWFSSDPHYGHSNIIGFCNRPFNNTWEMDKQLITNHNAVVNVDDDVYFNGDFVWKNKGRTIEILRQLNGKKHMIFGNHDGSLATITEEGIIVRPEVAPYVEWVKPYHEMTIQDPTAVHKKQMIVLMHYAMRVWNKSHHGSFHLYGHSHGSLPEDQTVLSIDVGVDAVAKRYSIGGELNPKDYRPISYEEIKAIMKNKQNLPVDKHRKVNCKEAT